MTNDMIREGVRVYLEHCPDTGTGDRLDWEMVAEIYAAMEAARVAPQHLDVNPEQDY